MGRASPSFWLDSWLGHHESLFDRCKTGAIVIHVSNSRGSRMEPADRQEQIVRVAATHLSRDGAAGVSMSSIAKDAGVTRALIYRYFPGKQALLDAVLRHESERLLAATEPDPKLSVATSSPLAQRLPRLLQRQQRRSARAVHRFRQPRRPGVGRGQPRAPGDAHPAGPGARRHPPSPTGSRRLAGARGVHRPPRRRGSPRDDAVDLCITALVALLGQDLA